MFDEPKEIFAENNLDIEQLAYLTCRGGWPQASMLDGAVALDQARDYFDSVAHYDIQRTDGVDRDLERVKLLMRSYARECCKNDPEGVKHVVYSFGPGL